MGHVNNLFGGVLRTWVKETEELIRAVFCGK